MADKRKLFGTDGVRGRANVHPMTAEMALSQSWGEIPVGDARETAVFGVRKGEHAMLLAVDRAVRDLARSGAGS